MSCLNGVTRFEDARGSHEHDLDPLRIAYECSNGHRFSLVIHHRCPVTDCDWNTRNPMLGTICRAK